MNRAIIWPLLIIIGLIAFIAPGMFLGMNTGLLIGAGIMILFVLIFYFANKSKVPQTRNPAEWWKSMTTPNQVTTAQITGKVILILVVTAILFILFQNRLDPQTMTFAIPIFIIFMLILFLGFPARFFLGILVISGLPVGFWLMSIMKAPPILIALFLIAYLIIFPIVLKGFGWFLSIIGLIGIIYLIAVSPTDVLDRSTENSVVLMQQGFIEIRNWLEDQWNAVVKGGERVMAGTLGEGYFEGEVQETQDKKLGVFIDSFSSLTSKYTEGEPIFLDAELHAETLDDSPIKVITKCTLDGKKADEIRPTSEFIVENHATKNIACIFDEGRFERGNYNAIFGAEFNFTTNAFIKSYFMGIDQKREFEKQNIDFEDKFGIETRPTAIYSAGPMMIGMSLGKMPLGISTESESGPIIQLTLDNWWNGKIKKIKKLTVITPTEIKIGKLYPWGDEGECEGCEQGSAECKCEFDLSKKELEKQNVNSLRIMTTIQNHEKLLGNSPISFKTIKTILDYDYIVEEELEVSVIRPLTE